MRIFCISLIRPSLETRFLGFSITVGGCCSGRLHSGNNCISTKKQVEFL